METIEIKTLIDITKPNVSRPGQGTELEQQQYKNWITLQQCIGLRSIIEYDAIPTVNFVDLRGKGFGSKYKGEHKVWTFRFRPDRTMAYDSQGNIIGLLYNDLHQVPMIKKLTETINILKEMFDLEDPQYRNTTVTALIEQPQTDKDDHELRNNGH
jgi:hypothetical protein